MTLSSLDSPNGGNLLGKYLTWSLFSPSERTIVSYGKDEDEREDDLLCKRSYSIKNRSTGQGEDFAGVSTGIEAVVFVPACFSRANISLSVESTSVESLVKIV